MSVGLSPFGAASGRLFFRRRSRRGTRRRKTHHAVARVALELSNWGSKTLKSEGVGGALSAFGGGGRARGAFWSGKPTISAQNR
jgi:hypothetical protein